VGVSEKVLISVAWSCDGHVILAGSGVSSDIEAWKVEDLSLKRSIDIG
jgi:hypothetical protein